MEPARSRRFDPFDAAHVTARDGVLDRSYEASKRHFWNDTDVLDALIAEHGRPRVPADQRESLVAILSPIYYGEIVALHVSADLLRRVPDLAAQKVLAAQVIEEAKHVTALQRYLREAGLALPPIDPWARRMLEGVLRTRDVRLKLMGMQLVTENVAHAIFRNLVANLGEPVLKALLEYIDRDEVKHVGLAKKYLPRLLRGVRLRELPRMWATQAYWSTCLLRAMLRNREHAERLGIDINANMKREFRDLNRVVRSLGPRRRDRLAVAALPDAWNDRLVDLVFPPRRAA